MKTDPRGVWRGNPRFLSNLPASLKLECEKLASEKTEMQRHYVMVGVPALAAPTLVLSLKKAAWGLGYQALFLWVPPVPRLGDCLLVSSV